MDPEALLLLTLEVGRRDPRLFDELLDWMALNGQLLSPHRLRNMNRMHPGDPLLVESSMAWAADQNPSLRWRVRTPDRAPQSRQDIFPRDVVGLIREEDPIFARFGLRRPKANPSGKSEEPEPSESINLAYQLRYLFGTGTRPEVVRILLTSEEPRLDAAQITEQVGFEKRNVNEALAALVRSRVAKMRPLGNRRTYFLYRDKWTTLLEIGPNQQSLPGARPWVHLFRALTAVHVWLEREADHESSAYLIASEARQLIESHKASISKAGVEVSLGHSAAGADFGRTFEPIVDGLLKLLEPLRRQPAGRGKKK